MASSTSATKTLSLVHHKTSLKSLTRGTLQQPQNIKSQIKRPMSGSPKNWENLPRCRWGRWKIWAESGKLEGRDPEAEGKSEVQPNLAAHPFLLRMKEGYQALAKSNLRLKNKHEIMKKKITDQAKSKPSLQKQTYLLSSQGCKALSLRQSRVPNLFLKRRRLYLFEPLRIQRR